MRHVQSSVSSSEAAGARKRISSPELHSFVTVPPSDYETLPGLLRVLRRRWFTVVMVSAIIIGAGVTLCLRMTRKYTATSTLEVEQERRIDNGTTSNVQEASGEDELKTEVQTDINILQSPGIALSVIQQLQLNRRRPFTAAVDPEEKGRNIGEAPRTRERMVKLFERDLKVSSPEDTRLIDISYQNPDPVLASEVANTVGHTFIESTLERHHRSTAESSFWLQKELMDLKGQVEASEQKLADYERKTGMAGVQVSGASTGDGASSVSVSSNNTVMERLFALNQELTAAEANRISTEMVYHLVQSNNPEVVLGLGTMSVSNANGGGTGSLTSDSGIDLVRSLRAQQAELAREYASRSVTYGSNDAYILQLKKQIDAVEQQSQAELARIRKRAENAYLYAKRNEDTIRQQFTQQQAAANVMADDTVKLQILAQEAYSNRSLYESLFSKLQSASLAAGVRAAQIDVVDAARPPGWPSSPEYLKYIGLITGFGLFCGVAAAFLRESLDETVRTPQHLLEIFDVPMLGYVPNVNTPKRLDSGEGGSRLISEPTSPFSESFRAIRTALLFSMPLTKTRSLLVTSALGGEGKTTMLYNLGVAFAQGGARVLLIDADLRNPDLHRYFGADVSPGLSELLGEVVEKQGWSHVVRHPKLQTLYMLPAGKQPELPTELFGLPAFDAFLAQCEARYDYVLIDSPPVLPVADASVIAPKAGGIVAIVRSGMTTRSSFSALMQSLDRVRTPLLGVALNDVRQPNLDELPNYSYSRMNRGETIDANA